MKQYLRRTCPTCGLDIEFGLWAHAIQCAKDKEQREAAKRETRIRRREITPERWEELQVALDRPEGPTEVEAEEVLQHYGTSGREVTNQFIERLLRENLELKQRLSRATPSPADAEQESVAETAAEIARLTKWQDLCFELLSEVRQWVAPGSIIDTDAPRVLRALLRERAELRQAAHALADAEKRARQLLGDLQRRGFLDDAIFENPNFDDSFVVSLVTAALSSRPVVASKGDSHD